MRNIHETVKIPPMGAATSSGVAILPVRRVPLDAPYEWLAAGWRDMWTNPAVSLGYGAVFTLGAAVLIAALSTLNTLALILPLAGGFLLIAPLFAAGLYEMSRRMERGEPAGAGDVIAAGLHARGQLAFMGVVLMVIFMAWMDLAFLMFMLFWGANPVPPLSGFLPALLDTPHGLALLIAGTASGAVLAAMTFAISAISVPMLMDRRVDTVTAITTSLRAASVNWQAMSLWAALIVLLMGLGFVTLFAGLIVAFPLAGHATWHAYRHMAGGGRGD
jgi:uncharacterized membrane protein